MWMNIEAGRGQQGQLGGRGEADEQRDGGKQHVLTLADVKTPHRCFTSVFQLFHISCILMFMFVNFVLKQTMRLQTFSSF